VGDGQLGTVTAVGGCALPGEGDLGVDSWVRVATLKVRLNRSGPTVLSTGPSEDVVYGIAVFDSFGNLDVSQVSYGDCKVIGFERKQEIPVRVRKK
jgi:hypothetical protein